MGKYRVVSGEGPTNTPVERGSIRPFAVIPGLPSPEDLRAEINHMHAVLLGQEESPIGRSITSLMEVADAYYGRACQLSSLIFTGEQEGAIKSGSPYTKIRTSQLRELKDAAKVHMQTGSRRLSAAQFRVDLKEHGMDDLYDE